MKKVFVIGAGTGLDAIEKAKKFLELKEDVEIICVESIEDVPLPERLNSDLSEIHKFSAPPILSSLTYFDDKKRKGYERPYKYHR
jgi:hypothetical protein